MLQSEVHTRIITLRPAPFLELNSSLMPSLVPVLPLTLLSSNGILKIVRLKTVEIASRTTNPNWMSCLKTQVKITIVEESTKGL